MSTTKLTGRISLAPMIDKTEPRFRYFIRRLFPEIHLYTEMTGSGAIIYGQHKRFLDLHPAESPVALQLGTHSPEEAYKAVFMAREYTAQQPDQAPGFKAPDFKPSGFTEYNLNAGCPSDRVQNRNIGAIQMNDPSLVAEILAAMRQALNDSQDLYPGRPLPEVTLKHRLGIEQPSRGIDMTKAEQLYVFLRRVAPFCDRLIIHARIAILDGLDPKQNREIPPLNYPLVCQIRRDFAPLPVEINGGLKHSEQIAAIWPQVDGVMLGRVSYEDTWELFRIRKRLLTDGLLQAAPNSQATISSRSELVRCYAEYLEQHPSDQSPAAQIWPILTVWRGLPEARRWRHLLSPPYPAELSHDRSLAAVQLARRAHETIQELEHRYPNAKAKAQERET
ncbi:tRNA-dihydrouridine synthase [Candidatus Haliotispira prima]|uniref:tRNA-dihydrouridine synthase n=1 Tax=Candidatus Haliotispira prima TaxID=3034016 RepID=A0ABY8MI25_9SPIO|nr:tRNA-dihydrouridine synthase [Candidatus Haliotispira prima]